MKKQAIAIGFLFVLMTFSGCVAAGDVYKAGVWTTIIVIVLIVVLVLFIYNKFSGKKNG